MPGQRQRRQPQPGRPALGPLVQQRQCRFRQHHPGRLEQRSRLLQGKPEIRAADFGQLALQPQPVQTEPRFPAGGEHYPQFRGPVPDQQLKLSQGLAGVQLVHVIDHQPDPVRQRAQVREQPLGRPAAAGICRRRGPHQRSADRGAAQPVGHRGPESLLVTPLCGDPGGAVGQPRRADPRPQQRGLATPGGRRNLGDTGRCPEPGEQPVAEDHPVADRRGRREPGIGGRGWTGSCHDTHWDAEASLCV